MNDSWAGSTRSNAKTQGSNERLHYSVRNAVIEPRRHDATQ
jgi:hypothetical protein